MIWSSDHSLLEEVSTGEQWIAWRPGGPIRQRRQIHGLGYSVFVSVPVCGLAYVCKKFSAQKSERHTRTHARRTRSPRPATYAVRRRQRAARPGQPVSR